MDVLQQVNTARLVSAVSASHVLAYGSLSNIKVAAGIKDRDVPVLYFHLITGGPVLNTGLFGPVSPWRRLLMEENSSIRADFFSFFFFAPAQGSHSIMQHRAFLMVLCVTGLHAVLYMIPCHVFTLWAKTVLQPLSHTLY